MRAIAPACQHLAQALDLAEALDPGDAPMLGVALDAYHVWWDPDLARQVARAGRRLFALHVCDWLVPTRDLLEDRGMMGDGVIDLPAFSAMVEAASYTGFTEVEIFSAQNWWKRPMDETLAVCRERLATAT
jgi:sugar phosphate isomerase/epimerase